MDSDSSLEFYQRVVIAPIIGYDRRSKKSSYDNSQNSYEETLFHDCTSILFFTSLTQTTAFFIANGQRIIGPDSTRSGASGVNPHTGEFWLTRLGFCEDRELRGRFLIQITFRVFERADVGFRTTVETMHLMAIAERDPALKSSLE
jgi:hypothetical protein